eukprot:3271193-Heterocapsa_arctica.AAC.1
MSVSTALMRGEWSPSLRARLRERGSRGVPRSSLSGGVGGGGPAGGRGCRRRGGGLGASSLS